MKKILLCIIIIFSNQQNLISQSGSTYTRYGIGDIEYSYSARRSGMGQLGVSVADADFINSLNPAGWYKINRTRIEFGLYYNGMFLSDKNNSGYFAETEFSGVTIAFPLSELYGISVATGLIPVSNVSYKIKESYELPQSYKVSYEGSGGLSKVFIGTSYKLPFDLVVGATADYYFGNLLYKSRSELTTSTSNYAEYENSYRPKGLGGTFGFISPDLSYLVDTSFVNDLRFGLSISYTGSLDLDTILTSTSSSGVDTNYAGNGEMGIPIRITLGANIVLAGNYLLSLDYSFQPWSEYKINSITQPGLQDAQKLSLGFEYHPDFSPGNTFWEQIIWRSGLSFEETQYMINNKGINQFSVSGGFSLPISYSNTLDLGVQYSVRGTKDSGLIKEDIIRLNFGISFGELWFIRPEN